MAVLPRMLNVPICFSAERLPLPNMRLAEILGLTYSTTATLYQYNDGRVIEYFVLHGQDAAVNRAIDNDQDPLSVTTPIPLEMLSIPTWTETMDRDTALALSKVYTLIGIVGHSTHVIIRNTRDYIVVTAGNEAAALHNYSLVNPILSPRLRIPALPHTWNWPSAIASSDREFFMIAELAWWMGHRYVSIAAPRLIAVWLNEPSRRPFAELTRTYILPPYSYEARLNHQ